MAPTQLSDIRAETSGCTIAVAVDEDGRHYFVSLGADRYRTVAWFPSSVREARRLFGAAATVALTRLELVGAFDRIAFVPIAR
jgi:hypothetical protein